MVKQINELQLGELEKTVRELFKGKEMIHIGLMKAGINTTQSTSKFFFRVLEDEIEIITDNTDYLINIEEIEDCFLRDRKKLTLLFSEYEKMIISI